MWCMNMMMQMLDHQSHAGHSTPNVPASALPNETVLDILKRRYALGEISQAQFEEMKRVLGLQNTVSVVSPTGEHTHQQRKGETYDE